MVWAEGWAGMAFQEGGGTGVVRWPSVGGGCVGLVGCLPDSAVSSAVDSSVEALQIFCTKLVQSLKMTALGAAGAGSWSFRCPRSFRCCRCCCRPCKHCAVVGVPSKSPIFFLWFCCWKVEFILEMGCLLLVPSCIQSTRFQLCTRIISQKLNLQRDSIGMPSNKLLVGRDLCFINAFVNATSLLDMFLIMCWSRGFWIAWNFGFAYLRHCSVDTLSCCSSWWCWSSSWSCRSLRSFRCCRRCCQPCKRCCCRCSFRSSSMSFWWLCASLWIACCRFPLVYRKYRCA